MLGGGTQKSLRKPLGAIKDSTTVNFKFFTFGVCPVLLVRVEEEPNGFCIKLLSCKLEGSPIVVAQNEEIDASMVNRVSCDRKQSDSSVAELTSDTVIEVSIEIPFAFRPIPVQAIESTGTQVLEQILRIMLPCFMAQVLLGITLLELDMLDTFEDVECNRCTVGVSLMEGLSPLNFYIEDEFYHATHGGARGVKSITNYVLSQHDELEAKFSRREHPLKLNSKAHSILLFFCTNIM